MRKLSLYMLYKLLIFVIFSDTVSNRASEFCKQDWSYIRDLLYKCGIIHDD